MRTLALALLLVPAIGLAQDAPIPYPEEEEEKPRELPRRSDPTYEAPEETDYEELEREQKLSRLDDPNRGFAGELLMGLMLLDSSKGALVESRFGWGLRFTWEYGRMLGERFREALFADVMWAHAGLHDGTKAVFGDTSYHYFSVAPAYELVFTKGAPFGVYGQLGFGLGYQLSTISIIGTDGRRDQQVSGVKPLIQYGIGFRGRPIVYPELPISISFRVELTRFRRGYMDDTFIGASAGAAF